MSQPSHEDGASSLGAVGGEASGAIKKRSKKKKHKEDRYSRRELLEMESLHTYCVGGVGQDGYCNIDLIGIDDL